MIKVTVSSLASENPVLSLSEGSFPISEVLLPHRLLVSMGVFLMAMVGNDPLWWL